MGNLIIASRDKHEIGEVLRTTFVEKDGEVEVSTQPFQIVRESNLKEYVRSNKEYFDIEVDEALCKLAYNYYYEVITD